MKKLIFTSVMLSLLLLTACFSGDKNPVKEMMPSESPKTHTETPTGGDAKVTEPAGGNIDTAQISEDAAKKTILEKIPGATEEHIKEWKTSRDDGRQKYEGKVIFEETEYEFELDANSGEMLKWETEAIHD